MQFQKDISNLVNDEVALEKLLNTVKSWQISVSYGELLGHICYLLQPLMSDLRFNDWMNYIILKQIHEICQRNYNDHDLIDVNKLRDYIVSNIGKIFEDLLINIRENEEQYLMSKFDQKYCVWSIKNKRRHMETFYSAFPCCNKLFDLKVNDISFYGIFDGHGGVHASKYCSTLIPFLFCQNLKSYESSDQEINTDIIETCLNKSIKDVEIKFIEISETFKWNSGTTVVVGVKYRNEIICSWLGDSVAIIVSSNGDSRVISNPLHHPDIKEEEQRIIENGGWIERNQYTTRVNGTIGVTRSIGDLNLKKYLSSKPDSTRYQINDHDKWLVLCCDGIWSHVESSRIGQLIAENYKKEPNSQQIISKLIVTEAIMEGSSDNLSIIVIDL